MKTEPSGEPRYLGRVYPERTPTFAELARDLRELHAHGGRPGDNDTILRRYIQSARQLERAAKAQRLDGRNIVPSAVLWSLALALALVGGYVLLPAIRGGQQGDLTGILILTLVGGVLGTSISLLYRDWLSLHVRWAHAYRDNLTTSQASLMSEAGLDGWRLIKSADESWRYVRIDDEAPAPKEESQE